LIIGKESWEKAKHTKTHLYLNYTIENFNH